MYFRFIKNQIYVYKYRLQNYLFSTTSVKTDFNKSALFNI